MKKVTICTVFLLLIWSSRLIAAEYQFKTIAVPGAAHTAVFGINGLGDVVGWFSEGTGPVITPQGFLYSDNQYHEIGIAGARSFVPSGINRAGLIVGSFSGTTGQHAFIMDDQQTTILEGAIRADGINNKNVVVGYQESGAINQLAYIWRDGQYRQPVTTKEVPGILGSAATGINGRGEVVGYYFFNTPTGQIVQGFVRRAGNLAPVDLIPLGINNVGQIVGLSGAGNDGAVLEDGIVTLIKYPGADYTQVHGINNKGHIVGYYLKAGQYYGFIGKPIVKVANGNKK